MHRLQHLKIVLWCDVFDVSVRFVWMFCLSNTREALSKVGTKFRPCTGRRQETAKSMLRWIVKWCHMSVVFSYLCFGFVFSRGSVHLMVSKLFCWRESHLASLIRIQALHLSSQILLGREPALSPALWAHARYFITPRKKLWFLQWLLWKHPSTWAPERGVLSQVVQAWSLRSSSLGKPGNDLGVNLSQNICPCRVQWFHARMQRWCISEASNFIVDGSVKTRWYPPYHFYLLGLVPGPLECSGKSHVTPEIVSGLPCPFIFTNAFMGVYRMLCHHNISESDCSMTVALFVYSIPFGLLTCSIQGTVMVMCLSRYPGACWNWNCLELLELIRPMEFIGDLGWQPQWAVALKVFSRVTWPSDHWNHWNHLWPENCNCPFARFARLPGLEHQPLPSPGPEQESIPNLDVQKLTFCWKIMLKKAERMWKPW